MRFGPLTTRTKLMIIDADVVEYISQVLPGKSTREIIGKLGEAKSMAFSINRSNGPKGKNDLNSPEGTTDMADIKALLAHIGQLLAGA